MVLRRAIGLPTRVLSSEVLTESRAQSTHHDDEIKVSLGPYSHILPERPLVKVRARDGFSTVKVAVQIDGDELRSVPR